jgi:hypothetical protein
LAETASVSPLEDHCTRKSIRLAELKPKRNVKLQDCELYGPAVMVTWGGIFVDSAFSDCDFIVVKPIAGLRAQSSWTTVRLRGAYSIALSKDQYAQANGARDVPLYLHPGMFHERASRQSDGGLLPTERIPTPQQWREFGAEPIVTDKPLTCLDDLLYVSGEIHRLASTEVVEIQLGTECVEAVWLEVAIGPVG